MVVEMCLTALLSGTLEYDGSKLGKTIDAESKIVTEYSGKTLYVLPDRYNLVQLCDKGERFPVSISDKDKFDLIKQ